MIKPLMLAIVIGIYVGYSIITTDIIHWWMHTLVGFGAGYNICKLVYEDD